MRSTIEFQPFDLVRLVLSLIPFDWDCLEIASFLLRYVKKSLRNYPVKLPSSAHCWLKRDKSDSLSFLVKLYVFRTRSKRGFYYDWSGLLWLVYIWLIMKIILCRLAFQLRTERSYELDILFKKCRMIQKKIDKDQRILPLTVIAIDSKLWGF